MSNFYIRADFIKGGKFTTEIVQEIIPQFFFFFGILSFVNNDMNSIARNCKFTIFFL